MDNLSHTIRKFNRFELKYVISLKQAEQFKSALRKYLVPDENGNNKGSYDPTSMYYDSRDLRCYYEKMDGIKFRRKLRIRHYESGEFFTDQTPVFVEIKQRVDRVTQKRRTVLPYREALRLCNDRQIPDFIPEDRAIIDEIYVFLWQYNLLPASIVRYNRQAFIGTEYDLGLRVTFDTALTTQAYPLHLHEPLSGIPMMGMNCVIMEIKVNERIPYWLSELVAVHNLQMTRVSKYCRSIDIIHDSSPALWSNLMAESSQDVLSSVPSVFQPQEWKVEINKQ